MGAQRRQTSGGVIVHGKRLSVHATRRRQDVERLSAHRPPRVQAGCRSRGGYAVVMHLCCQTYPGLALSDDTARIGVRVSVAFGTTGGFGRSSMMPNRRAVGGSETDRTHVSAQTLQRICCRRAAHCDALRQQHSHRLYATMNAIYGRLQSILDCMHDA